ncbi:PI31 proteasome regulator N-terminal-domain-containing protein [Xylogone sp. PMI_703]|nr:PI31 proteasome regulator N-terminal-domain-containing protein [Xylogone sp. PMI_703]
MVNNPLNTDNVLKLMAEALPTHAPGDTNSDISSSYEAIALFAHACMIAVGFRLIGFGEGDKNEEECQRSAPRLLHKWNSSYGSHSFLYAHSQSSMQYVIKIDRLGGKAEIRGIGLGDERITRFEITAKDYISSAALPLRIKIGEDGQEDRTGLESKLQEVFISPSRIQDLASLYKITIIQKLVPSLQKEGYEEAASDARRDAREEREAASSSRRPPPHDPLPQPARPYPFDDPLAAAPRRPIPQGDFPPPGFDDEYDLNRPLRPLGAFPGAGSGRSPFNIGHDDLNPPGLGPHDPLRGSFVGGGGLPRPGGGGMHPTFDDPLFGGRGQGGGPYDPQAPPGARYDPLGPGDGPQRGAGGRPPNPFGGFGSGDFI